MTIPKPLACIIMVLVFYGLSVGLTAGFHELWGMAFLLVSLRFILEINRP